MHNDMYQKFCPCFITLCYFFYCVLFPFSSLTIYRCAIIFGVPGYSYVYNIRAYHCLGIVSEPIGTAGAVLIRSVRFSNGDHINGPGKLCRYLDITRTYNGIDLTSDSNFYISEGKPIENYKTTQRIGITKNVDKLWRFVAIE